MNVMQPVQRNKNSTYDCILRQQSPVGLQHVCCFDISNSAVNLCLYHSMPCVSHKQLHAASFSK